MALKFYGTMMCPDCVNAQKVLDDSGTSYEYIDIAGSVQALKEFMILRDSAPAFNEAKSERFIGIPAFLTDDNPSTATLDVHAVVQK